MQLLIMIKMCTVYTHKYFFDTISLFKSVIRRAVTGGSVTSLQTHSLMGRDESLVMTATDGSSLRSEV